MKIFTVLAFALSACMLTGCMTTPGDGFTVHEDDWRFRVFQYCVCLDGDEDCEQCQSRSYYLPLNFRGYTKNPHETIHLEQWVPDRQSVHNAFHVIDRLEGPIVSDNRDEIYLDSNRLGSRIRGNWERIDTVRSMGTELPGGWYNWSSSIEFRSVYCGGASWEAAFAKKPDRDNTWRFDFRAVGENGNVLYCWEQGFHNYFLSESDLLTQYAEHMAAAPGTMSIFFDRNDR